MIKNINLSIFLIFVILPLAVVGAPVVKIDSAIAPPGGTNTTNITAYNVTYFSNYAITIRFNPAVVNITGATFNPAMGNLAFFENNVSGGYVRIYTLNLGLPGSPFPDQSGNILLATLNMKAIANSGISPLNVEIGKMVHTNKTEFNAESVSGTFTISLKGDLNGNGMIDIGDAAMVAYMVVGKIPQNLNVDFNNNSHVDIGDASKIVYFLVGKVNEL